MYILLTLIIIGICLVCLKLLTNDMALRLTSIIYNCDYDELKQLMKKKK